MFAQIALGVDFMHMKHVVTKNLYAKHIYLQQETTLIEDQKVKGKMKLKIGSFNNAAVVQQTLALTGRPYYMARYQAPEIQSYNDGDDLQFSNKTDVFALGVVLLEMCTREFGDEEEDLNIDIEQSIKDVEE